MTTADIKKLLSGKPDPKARAAVMAALGGPKPNPTKPADADKVATLEALYLEAAEALLPGHGGPQVRIRELKERYSHYNPGMQKMQLTAALKKLRSAK